MAKKSPVRDYKVTDFDENGELKEGKEQNALRKAAAEKRAALLAPVTAEPNPVDLEVEKILESSKKTGSVEKAETEKK